MGNPTGETSTAPPASASPPLGHGPTKVLVLPGLFGGRGGFDAMLAIADRRSFEYVVMDYRGYGAARHAPGPFTLHQIVIDAMRRLDDLGWSEVNLVGHSLGALVAQMLALEAPGRVARIVSIAGLTARGAAPDPARAKRLAEAAHDMAVRERIVDAGVGNRYRAGFARAIVDAGRDWIEPRAFASYAADAARTDIQARVAGSGVPFLALIGAHDPGNTERAAREVTARLYRNAVIEVLAEVGHQPMIEAPARTLTAIEAFLLAPLPSRPGRD